ncbi:MAG: FGGY-family carbohydrate kinase [Chloroflexota bacterium]
MTNQMLLGLDIGTSLIKAVIFDLYGKELGQGTAKVDVESPHPGWQEQNMDAVWEGADAAIQGALCESGVEPAEIAAVGTAGQGDGLWMIDAAGNPVGPALLWNDGRAAEVIAEWEADGSLSALYAVGGTVLWPGAQAALLAWMRCHEPQKLAQAATIFCCKDWVSYKLTGVRSTDETDGSIPFMGMVARAYDESQMSLLGLAELRSKLPHAHHSDQVIGHVTREAAVATGLAAGTPVIAGLLDVAASAIGVGAIDAGQSFTLIGTTALNAIVLDEPNLVPADIGATVCHGLPQRWMRVLAAMSGTPNLDWYIAELSRAAEVTTSGEVFVEMEAVMSSVPVGSGGVIFHPYLSGERAPFLDTSARAGFFGIGAETTQAHLTRAVYEGIALSIRDCFERIGGGVSQIRLAGGGSNSEAWRQMLADVTNCTMEIPAGSELGALGAAITAGVGIGLFDSYQSAVNQCVRIEQSYHPNPTNVAKYTEIYQLYRMLIEQLTPFWHQRQAMLARW